METHRKLYRSNERRVVGGVAGGLAEYFNIDPLIVRLLFAVGLFFGGATLLAYLVMWVCIPRDPFGDTGRSSTFGLLFKGVAILACVGIIASQFDSEFWVGGFAIGLCIGLYFYWRSRRDDSDDEPAYESLNRTRLYRSTSDKKNSWSIWWYRIGNQC
jgi:phage shock protein PspC (stress-responsive transcriptional regulator)